MVSAGGAKPFCSVANTRSLDTDAGTAFGGTISLKWPSLENKLTAVALFQAKEGNSTCQVYIENRLRQHQSLVVWLKPIERGYLL